MASNSSIAPVATAVLAEVTVVAIIATNGNTSRGSHTCGSIMYGRLTNRNRGSSEFLQEEEPVPPLTLVAPLLLQEEAEAAVAPVATPAAETVPVVAPETHSDLSITFFNFYFEECHHLGEVCVFLYTNFPYFPKLLI
ncbi:MAG: hypothetical protein WC694_02380 [Candidatus Paceibacterota bacterium]|jgi:hypothetical protein